MRAERIAAPPWVYVGRRRAVMDKDGVAVCRVCDRLSPGELGNSASLIAAAPELLAACKALLSAVVNAPRSVISQPPFPHAIELADNAIAKATDGTGKE